jgi:uncharacterized protein
MINGIHSVLDTVMDWAIKNTIQEVLVLDGVPVQGIPRSDRHTTILQSTEMENNITNDNSSSSSSSSSSNKNEEGNISISDNKGHIHSNFNNSAIEESLKKYTTFIGGIAGGLLSACLSNQIPCAAILVPSSSGIPDPEGAALLIESYNSIIKDENLKIDPTQLKEQGQILKRQLEQIIKAEQEQREQVTMTGQRVMYG